MLHTIFKYFSADFVIMPIKLLKGYANNISVKTPVCMSVYISLLHRSALQNLTLPKAISDVAVSRIYFNGTLLQAGPNTCHPKANNTTFNHYGLSGLKNL